jgi:hypothetical protein
MFKEHLGFMPPQDQDHSVWRYMDFTKFLSLLDDQHLFFARADMLGDPFEGSLAQYNHVWAYKNLFIGIPPKK